LEISLYLIVRTIQPNREENMTMNAKRLLTLSCIVFTIAMGSASADVPQMTNYQGRLTDAAGNPIDTTVEMTFRLYEDEAGTSQLWKETHAGVVVTNGLFEVVLGSIQPLASSFFDGSEKWLGIQIDEGSVSLPLTPIVSVAYAERSIFSDTASYALAGSGGGSPWTDEGTVIHPSTLTDSVGIGTDDPTFPLEVEAPVTAILGHSLGTGLAIGVFGANDNDGVGVLGTSNSGNGVHGISLSGYGGYFFGPKNYFSNNLGIGTEDPEEMFHVYEDYTGRDCYMKVQTDHATNWGEAGLRLETPANYWRLYMDDDANGEIQAGGLGLYNGSTGDVEMTISSSGHFGLDMVPQSSTKFAVKGGTSAIRGEGTGSGTGIYGSSDTGYGGYFIAPKHYFSGLVGINTLTPTHMLSLNNGAFALLDNGTPKFHMNYYGGGFNISETTVADYRFYIKPGGNVGIGTSSPSAKLHVNGGARIAGTLDADDFEANSINYSDILDDVGIASAASSSVNLLGTGYSAYLTREITIPAPGYILAIASADVFLDHGISGMTSAALAISDLPNESDGSRVYELYLLSNVGAGSYGYTASCQQLFHPTSAGTYTYYLIGKRSADNDTYIDKRELDLLYIRTVYASKKQRRKVISAGRVYRSQTQHRRKRRMTSRSFGAM
jgi:hypothetical protein